MHKVRFLMTTYVYKFFPYGTKVCYEYEEWCEIVFICYRSCMIALDMRDRLGKS